MTMMLFMIILILSNQIGISHGQLKVGFYDKKCPNVESIVSGVVKRFSASNKNIAPVLLRLHFHDCFVQECDASILIENGPNAERHAFGHEGVGGFEVIEKAKAEVEAVCPRLISCADIVAIAARDAIFLVNGPFYNVETGRRDGLVSNVSLADNMPDVDDSIQQLKHKFFQKGLSHKDLVLLSAAHTIGTTACFFMTKRLYNFSPYKGSDPLINPTFLHELKSTCPQNGDVNVRLSMDRGSGETFDSQILQNIRSGFAVLQSDANLYNDETTRRVVDSYFAFLSPFLGTSFQADFANAMVKMGRIGVLTGSQGTIRRVCSDF
ncbi:peroxidase 43-like [Solanum lycopersicum]|uniref:peroxidase 43-like n=1 Tax=Solanum lycopersicum TaxID=4081 RepID=UPI0002BCBFA8|nr:peroxidase 43-like [Solanum lycopersicum]